MHLINEVDLESAYRRHVLNVVQQFSHVINAGSGGSIHFNQVDTSTFGDLKTGVTLTTRCRCDAGLTIQATSKNSCDGRFTDTPGAGKQVSVVQAIIIQCVN